MPTISPTHINKLQPLCRREAHPCVNKMQWQLLNLRLEAQMHINKLQHVPSDDLQHVPGGERLRRR